MECRKCKQSILENHIFCQNCGTKIKKNSTILTLFTIILIIITIPIILITFVLSQAWHTVKINKTFREMEENYLKSAVKKISI